MQPEPVPVARDVWLWVIGTALAIVVVVATSYLVLGGHGSDATSARSHHGVRLSE